MDTLNYTIDIEIWGYHHSSVDSILLPRFESQAHLLRFNKFIFELYHLE